MIKKQRKMYLVENEDFWCPTDHDSMNKILLRRFFYQFMEVFYKKTAIRMDPKHIKFLNTETKILNEKFGTWDTMVADLLVETIIDGENCLIHVETQAQRIQNYNEFMFRYFARLSEIFGERIIPIVMYTHDTKKLENDTYKKEIPGFMQLHFKFTTLQLNQYYWRDYIEEPNPVAAALITRMRYSEEEKVDVKLTSFEMLGQLDLTVEEVRFLIIYVETYLILSQEQDEDFLERLNKKGAEVVEMMTSFEKKAMAEGEARGEKRGEKRGLNQGLVRVAKTMLKNNYSVEEVSKVTELPVEKITCLN